MRLVKPRRKILENVKANGQGWAFCGNVGIPYRPYLAFYCPWCEKKVSIWDDSIHYYLVGLQPILFKCSNGVVQAFWIGECSHCHGLCWAFQKDTIKPRKHLVFRSQA